MSTNYTYGGSGEGQFSDHRPESASPNWEKIIVNVNRDPCVKQAI